MVHNNVLEAIGRTPLIRLNHMTMTILHRFLLNLRDLIFGGSIKTRTALNMILEAEKSGLLNSDTIIVEPTSGNQGIGLALVGAVRGYKVKIIMPDSQRKRRKTQACKALRC